MFTLKAYKYNENGDQVSKYIRDFQTLAYLKELLAEVLQNYEDYEILKNGKVIESNFRNVS